MSLWYTTLNHCNGQGGDSSADFTAGSFFDCFWFCTAEKKKHRIIFSLWNVYQLDAGVYGDTDLCGEKRWIFKRNAGISVCVNGVEGENPVFGHSLKSDWLHDCIRTVPVSLFSFADSYAVFHDSGHSTKFCVKESICHSAGFFFDCLLS